MASQDGPGAGADIGSLNPADEQEVIKALARTTVEEVAPEELPLFTPTSQAYFDPERAARPGGGGADDMLGFGIDAAAAAALVTPVALEAARGVLGYLIGELQTAFKDEAKPMIQSLMHRLLHRDEKPATQPDAGTNGGKPSPKEPPPSPDPFSEDQLKEVRKVALRTAERMGMDRDRATVVADAIVGAIVR